MKYLGQTSLSLAQIRRGIARLVAWAAVALGYSVTQASTLQGVVAIGMAMGAIVASMRMHLEDGPRVITLGIGMGLLIIMMIFRTRRSASVDDANLLKY